MLGSAKGQLKMCRCGSVILVTFPVAGRRAAEGFTLAYSSRAHSLLLKEGVVVNHEAEKEGGENAGAQLASSFSFSPGSQDFAIMPTFRVSLPCPAKPSGNIFTDTPRCTFSW